MIWTMARARAQFSEVVRRAVDEGPQTLCLRGEETVIVVSKELYDRWSQQKRQRDGES